MRLLDRKLAKTQHYSLQIREVDALAFVFLIGFLTTFYNYQFVSLVQIDMLPMIYREADPQFLTNDFYTNSSQLFNEDFVFAKLVGGLGRVFGVPWVVFALTLFANLGISLASYFATKDLSKGNRLSGMFAALLIMSIYTFQWGNRAELFRFDLTPEHLIMPFLILAIWQGLKGGILGVGLFASLATIIHPLSGPGIGGIMLLQILIGKIYRKELNKADWLKFLIAGILISTPAMVYVASYLQSFDYQISNALFIEIMNVRFPHHYFPSFFLEPKKVLQGLLFLAIATFCWQRIKESIIPDKPVFRSLLITSAILVVLCFMGWFFAETVPNRFIITLQLWRFLSIAKILGIIGVAIFLGVGLKALSTTFSSLKTVGWLFLVFACCLFWAVEQKLMACLLVLMVFLVVWRKLYWVSLVSILLLVIHNNFQTTANDDGDIAVFKYFKPKVAISDLNDPEAALASFIRENTPEESRLLCGPRNGRLRILAKRALVVDAHSIPMNDKGLEEWWKRIQAVYLQNQTKELTHIKQTEKCYNLLEDKDYISLKNKYDFDYVVVRRGHSSKLKTLYKNHYFKLLEIPKSEP